MFSSSYYYYYSWTKLCELCTFVSKSHRNNEFDSQKNILSLANFANFHYLCKINNYYLKNGEI